jgi:hypothetical protein
MFEYTEVNGVICQYLCPQAPGVFVKEKFIRKWSNASQWPNGTVPVAGSNVTLNGNWTVVLDVDPAPLDFLIVDGTIFADDTRNVNLIANSIHIRYGNISAGSASTPFLHNFTIQLNGLQTSLGYTIDSVIAANKFLVVTGSLNLYGNTPGTVTTYLSASAFAGDSLLYVGGNSGWNAGDSLVLSPSFGVYNQY